MLAVDTVALSDRLRETILASNLSYREISKETGVDHARLSRFMRGQRGLSLDAADALAEYFNLDLSPKIAGAKRKASKKTPKQ